MVENGVVMARLKGLEGHALAAERRRLAITSGDSNRKQRAEKHGVVVLGSVAATVRFILSEA
jgi:hypothetical protein